MTDQLLFHQCRFHPHGHAVPAQGATAAPCGCITRTGYCVASRVHVAAIDKSTCPDHAPAEACS